MLDENKPFTHTAWAQHHQGGKFRKWVEVGQGYLEIDAEGNATAHVFSDRIPRGDTGYTCLAPNGIRPKDPEPRPQRPGQDELKSISN